MLLDGNSSITGFPSASSLVMSAPQGATRQPHWHRPAHWW